RECRIKRGEGQSPVSFDGMSPEDRLKSEPADGDDPAKAFHRRCVLEDLDYALHTLEADYKRRGEIKVFESLKPLVLKRSDRPHEELAKELGMAVGAVTTALSRLRTRLREAI